MKENGWPMRVDPLFHAFVKEMVQKNPDLNQRKVTKNIAKKKLIIGELLFNDSFEEEISRRIQAEYKKHEDFEKELQERFFL